MNNKTIGLIGVILGGLCLSLELYMLDIVKVLEKSTGKCYTNTWSYVTEFPFNIALLITLSIIGFSLFIYFNKSKKGQ